MSVICKVDGKEFPSDKALHMSLKGYGLNKVKYYQTYFERRDLLTNELINFKTKDQYLNSDFNDKNNMKKWLKQQPIEKVQEYCKQLLSKRKNEKNSLHLPWKKKRLQMIPTRCQKRPKTEAKDHKMVRIGMEVCTKVKRDLKQRQNRLTNGSDGLGLHIHVPQFQAHVVSRQNVPPIAA